MKTYGYAIFVMANFLLVSITEGRVRNGYDSEFRPAQDAFNNLNEMLKCDSALTPLATKMIKENIARLKTFFVYRELTENLLLQFKLISPGSYNEIDTITDRMHRPVDVYVKFLPPGAMRGSVAAGNKMPDGNDEDAYNSTYGLHTAAIYVVTLKNGLSLLAHEFGHIHYQVHNIAEYRRFFKKYYEDKSPESQEIGHHHMDKSGLNASTFEKRFRSHYSDFRRTHNATYVDPLTLLQDITERLDLGLIAVR